MPLWGAEKCDLRMEETLNRDLVRQLVASNLDAQISTMPLGWSCGPGRLLD